MRIERFLVYALVALVGLYLLAAILYAIPMIDGVKFDRPNPSIVADCGNGLNAAQRVSFHHVSYGYEITPRPASGGHRPIEGRDERERCTRKRSEAERAGCAMTDRSGSKLPTRPFDPFHTVQVRSDEGREFTQMPSWADARARGDDVPSAAVRILQ